MVNFEFLDSETWDGIVNDYAADYGQVNRSPEGITDAVNPFNDEPITDSLQTRYYYEWEIERDATHDFVKLVRDGQVDAAKENGITDFIWIAILDDRTCEKCCEWRNGLSSSMIEKRLKEDAELEDACDAIVPPAHFNCRCTVAPMTDDLEVYDISQTEKEFDQWLKP